jgi:hypothetical protein
MVILGQASDEAVIREALDPTASIEQGSSAVRLAGGVRSTDGRIAWAHPFGEDVVEWVGIRGAGLVTVLDGMPVDWVAEETL